MAARLVIVGCRWLRRLAATSQVGADDGRVVGEQRGDEAPGRVRARMPVQEEHWCPGSAVSDTQHGVTDIDPSQFEPFEHDS